MAGTYIRTVIGTLAMVGLAMAAVGCQAHPADWAELGSQNQDQRQNPSRSGNANGLHVVAGPSRFVAQLKAADVVKIMQTVGCSNEQILQVGHDLRDALAQSGAAQIMVGKKIEASVQVGNNQVLISSATRGMFVYDLRRGEVGLPNVPPGQSMQPPQRQTRQQ